MDWQQKFIHIVHIDVCKIIYIQPIQRKPALKFGLSKSLPI